MPRNAVLLEVNLDAVLQKIRVSLQKLVYLVGAGLQHVQDIDSARLEIDKTLSIKFLPAYQWDAEELKKTYKQWIITNGFRDAIEFVSKALEDAHKVATIWDFPVSEGVIVSMDADAAERVFGLDRKFHQLGLPDKLKHISEEHNITLEKKLASHIRSINCARNCFVHRGGLVSEVDYNIETEMRVTWYRLHVYIKKGEAESTLIDGAERGGDVFVRREEAMKSFVVGQTLQFSEQDFIDVCWTLNLFGEDLLKSLKECGVKRGAYPE